MRLKIATTACMIFGLLLLASWPWLVGPRPDPDVATREQLARYALRLMIYMGGAVLAFCTTALLAILTLRQARKEYRAQARANLEELLEGTLNDHGRANRPGPDA